MSYCITWQISVSLLDAIPQDAPTICNQAGLWPGVWLSAACLASFACRQFLISISDATLPSIASAVMALRRAAFSDLRNSASYLSR